MLYKIMEIIQGSHFIRNDQTLDAADFDPYFMEEGQSLYEVIRIITGVPLFMEEHLERLVRSAEKTNHQLNISQQEIRERVDKLIHACQTKVGNIKIVINYRSKEANISVDFYVFFIPHHYPSEQDYMQGIDTISFYAERNNPHAKVANLALNASVQQKIKQHNVYEALLLDHNGYITEGSRSNIFMVKDNSVFTTPLKDVLPGITRGFVLLVCQKLAYPVIEKNISLAELNKMEAIFLTGTSPNVLPIRKVDQLSFNSATNIVVQNIMHEYNNLIKNYINDYSK